MAATNQSVTPVCVNHPTVETELRCSRCELSICGRCAVATEVGTRCANCAGRRSAASYELPSRLALRALLSGLLLAALLGLGMGQWLEWGFWWALALGIATGEVVARAASERRGRLLQLIAAGCVLLALGLALWWNAREVLDGQVGLLLDSDVLREINDTPGFREALGLTPSNLLFGALAVFLATRRVR